MHTAVRLCTLLLAGLALSSVPQAQDAARPLPPSVMDISDCPSLPVENDPLLLRYLDSRSYGAGRWSADNSEIAFSTNWTGTSQKWRMPASGGFPQQITYFSNAISGCDYSPVDPNLMLVGVTEGGNERVQLYITSPDAVRLDPLLVNPEVFHRPGGISRDGQWLNFTRNDRDERWFDLWVVNIYTGEERLLWAPDANLSGGPWSPDGSAFLCSDSVSNFEVKRYLVDFATGERTLLTPEGAVAVFNTPRWLDNENIFFLSDHGREFNNLARININRPGEVEWVHTPDADIETMQISHDGRWIAWSENHDGYEHVTITSLPDLTPLPAPEIPRGLQMASEFSWDNRYILLQTTGPTGPGDIYRYELATGAVLRLTYSGTGGIDRSTFVEPSVVRIPSFDGLEISALWYEPDTPKPAGGWPVVVEAHGGPEGQSQPYFNPQVQMYLSKGYAVLLVNPRGSTGFGKTFEHLDDIELRLDSVHDYVAFRDWLVAEGHADESRIAIVGGSYGGYVVLAALAFHPDKFTCGVDLFGIANFVSFLNNTAPHRRAVREAEYGFLDRDMDFLVSASPINHIGNVTAPLLIMQGANDPRVPLSESTQMYEALKALGRDVELLVFADEGHGWAKRENRIIAWGTELNFLEKHIGAGN